MYKTVIKQLLCLYQWLLRLYPPTHYEEYSTLMQDTADQILWDAVQHKGWRGLLFAVIRLLFDLTQSISREQIDHQKERWMPVVHTFKNNPKQLLFGLIMVLLGVAILPLFSLLGTLQLIAGLFGPLLLLLSIWHIRRDLAYISPYTWQGIIALSLLGPLVKTSEWVFNSYQPELTTLWMSFSIGGVLLGTALLVHWISKRAGLATLPATAITFAILARYADLDYFTFEISYIIRLLPLIAIPLVGLWWMIIRHDTMRTNGVLILWTLIMISIISLNLYGRHVVGGTNHVALYPPIYALTSIIALFIASTLSKSNALEDTPSKPFVERNI